MHISRNSASKQDPSYLQDVSTSDMRVLPLLALILCLIADKQCRAFGGAAFGRFFRPTVEDAIPTETEVDEKVPQDIVDRQTRFAPNSLIPRSVFALHT